jgi:TatD DNase family protein
MWIDNHCHLEDERIPGGPAAAVERAMAAGVHTMITIGTDASHSEAAIAIAAAHDTVWATVGLHPHDAVNGIESIVGLLDAPKVVAIGECGLDYHYDHSPRDVQRAVFAAHVALAHERDLALVIHTRDAWDDTFDILRAEGVPERTIFHCFSGGSEEASLCLDLGAYLSFSGIVTFPSAASLREAAQRCPLDRLLVETDSPYLAPVPHRGRTNEPAYVPIVGAAIAAVKGVTVDTVAETSTRAATVAFSLARA